MSIRKLYIYISTPKLLNVCISKNRGTSRQLLISEVFPLLTWSASLHAKTQVIFTLARRCTFSSYIARAVAEIPRRIAQKGRETFGLDSSSSSSYDARSKVLFIYRR